MLISLHETYLIIMAVGVMLLFDLSSLCFPKVDKDTYSSAAVHDVEELIEHTLSLISITFTDFMLYF